MKRKSYNQQSWFEDAIERIKAMGFEVTHDMPSKDVRWIMIRKGRIEGTMGFALKGPCYDVWWGVIGLDRKECFDKMTHCPILRQLPNPEKDNVARYWEEMQKAIDWLLTPEGLKKSKGFGKYDFKDRA